MFARDDVSQASGTDTRVLQRDIRARPPMFDSGSFRRSVAAAAALAIATVLAACGDSITYGGGGTPNPAFALSLGTAAVPLTPGATARTFIKATRSGGLTGTISYAVSGAPAGLQVAIAATSTQDSSTVTITAAATLAAGVYPIVVNATAPGALAEQAMIAVTVNGAPGQAPAIESVVTGAHTCALTTEGATYCWGYNANGQLGNNDTATITPMPVAAAGGVVFQTLSVSKVEDVTCGLAIGGAAYCWGENGAGQLGDGTSARRLVPTPVAGGLTFKSLAVGFGHTCAVAMNGTAYCWGSTPNGAFGDGSVGIRLTPMVSAPGMTFASIVAGADFTCALTADGAAYCWGVGVFGQLGNGVVGISPIPVAVEGGLTFRTLAAAGRAACGLTSAGKAYCWGSNSFGTVGDGTLVRRLTPVAVAGDLTFRSLSAGWETVCGVTDSSASYCWGYNFGAVGDGTTDARSAPVPVVGGQSFRSISAGTRYTCGVNTANAVFCWGANDNGGLGDGTTNTRLVPTAVRWP
jgi:alpha-tubulin suppressor-like RCC1 family protein